MSLRTFSKTQFFIQPQSLVGAGLSSVSNENAPPPPSVQEEGQHENPVYDAYQSMSPEEQQVIIFHNTL